MGKGFKEDKRTGKPQVKADADNTSRRTWNKDDFRKQAADREKQVRADQPVCGRLLHSSSESGHAGRQA